LVTNTEEHEIQKEPENIIQSPFFKRFGNIIASKQFQKEKWKLFTVPFGSEIRWADSQHLLVITPNTGILLLDRTNGKQSEFISLNKSPDMKVSTFYSLDK